MSDLGAPLYPVRVKRPLPTEPIIMPVHTEPIIMPVQEPILAPGMEPARVR